MIANGRPEETTDVTLYAGVRLWGGADFGINPEIDQGFGLSNTVGMAHFPSRGAYKIGANTPYPRLPQAFLRQVIPLSGERFNTELAANQMAGSKAAHNVTLTVGKFSVTDIFDTNTYTHDLRGEFLNWSIIDAGAFNYAADARGALMARRLNGHRMPGHCMRRISAFECPKWKKCQCGLRSVHAGHRVGTTLSNAWTPRQGEAGGLCQSRSDGRVSRRRATGAAYGRLT